MYNIDSYPSVAVIDPRTGMCVCGALVHDDVMFLGEKMVSWGILTANKFVHEITEFLVNNPYEDQGETNPSQVGGL